MSIQLKSIFLLLLLFGFAVLSWNCEKDDICDPATPVTPQLVFDFYTAADNMAAVVPRLEVSAVGYDSIFEFTNVSTIKLPLRLLENQTQFTFKLIVGNETPPLEFSDVITFNYTRKNEYVSRACGYKTTFELNNSAELQPAVLLNGNFPLIQGSWIKNILIENYSIQSENETHVEIYY